MREEKERRDREKNKGSSDFDIPSRTEDLELLVDEA